MAGWGRRAVGNAESRLEEDALFKEIGGQLDANFDYDQWQRTRKPAASLQPSKRPSTLDKIASDTVLQNEQFIVGSGHSSAIARGRRVQSAGSSCHGHGRKKEVAASVPDIHRLEAIKILQLRIKARRQTIDEYKLRQLELLECNMKLKEDIENMEAKSHADVKNLLRKYERFRGGINTLNCQFFKDLESAKADLVSTEKHIAAEIERRKKQVEAVDTVLQEKKKELHILQNFKDKEYPEKALKIAELQKEIKELDIHNKREEEELANVVDTEIGKINQRHTDKKSSKMDEAVTKAIEQMHPSLKQMAAHNETLQKEIEFHKAEIKSVQVEVSKLETEVEKLVKSPKSNIRMMMFPEFYPDRPKCTPDMEVLLDIPTHEWLPI